MRYGLLCLALLATLASCSAHSNTLASQSTTGTFAIPGSHEAWRYALPGAFEAFGSSGTSYIVASSGVLVALDAASGRVRWRADDIGPIRQVATGSGVVIAGLTDGSADAYALADGRLQWRARGLCGGGRFDGFDIIEILSENVIVGCGGGHIVRLATESGAVLARNDVVGMDYLSEIVPLSSCAYAISGQSSGAVTTANTAIVGCRRLEMILPTQTDASVLGVIGGEAVIDDACCNGRVDTYDPATIYRVNLSTHALSPRVDLSPQPGLYQTGQLGNAALIHNTLYLFVAHSVYDYGDPRFIEQPRVVVDTLESPPQPLSGDLVLGQIRQSDGTDAAALIRLGSTATVVWSRPQKKYAMQPFAVAQSPNVFEYIDSQGREVFVRVRDHTQMIAPANQECSPQHADDHAVIMRCPTSQLAGNTFAEYLAPLPWPKQ